MKKDHVIHQQKNTPTSDLVQKVLWTKDFTIITLGSIVSMAGGSMLAFAISLHVLDTVTVPFFFALILFLYTLPQVVASIFAGPLVDCLSRRRTIYVLDFSLLSSTELWDC